MNPVHPSLLSLLAAERIRTARPARRRPVGDLGPATVWSGGPTVRPRR